MASGALTDVYLDELATLYDAEMQALRVLPRLRDAARSMRLRDALTRHCDETRLHVERLQLIFTHWGGQAATRTIGWDSRNCSRSRRAPE